jgi:hypothetical protein
LRDGAGAGDWPSRHTRFAPRCEKKHQA